MNKSRFALAAIFFVAALLIPTTGCQNQADKAELQKLRAQAALQEQNKALVRKCMDYFNKKDPRAYVDCYAPNCVYYFPSAALKPTTAKEDSLSSMQLWKAFPDIQWTIEDMTAEGNMVTTRYVAKGTQKEAWMGIPATGAKFEMGGIFTNRIENGKIVEQREDADLFGAFQQLGMELKPAKGKK